MNYVNLTNGIEAIPDLPPGWAACRIQSTDVEHANLQKILIGLEEDILFNLARGEELGR